ncbi:MAG: type II toxin-antitoxin system HicA family toxin [Thermodesulfobacteriota bacterium]|nr:type II toxin-antitoxin system HicA family toxin [Thermodesulfobacteriota bacterium]
MSRYDKILSRISDRPVPSGIKWKEIKTLLLHLGYKQIQCGKTGGSRRKFYHKEKDDLIICHKPHPEPTIDKGCISNIVQHLKEHGFIQRGGA